MLFAQLLGSMSWKVGTGGEDAGIADKDVEPAEGADDVFHFLLHFRVVGEVDDDAVEAVVSGEALRGFRIEVHADDDGTLSLRARAMALPMPAAAAPVTMATLPCSGLGAGAFLSLACSRSQYWIFEEILLRQRVPAAGSLPPAGWCAACAARCR